MSKPLLAIANYRVSSDEQLLNNSLARQEQSVLKAANELGAEIVQTWSGSVSSKKWANLDREDLREMLHVSKQNPNIKYAIFDELDRFMRSMLELAHFIVEFKKLEVKVVFASQPNLKTDTASDTLLLMLEAFKAEGSNEERQRKSISGQYMALKEGRWPFPVKLGYKRGYQKGIPEVHEIHGKILQSSLMNIASRQVTPTQALIELNKSEMQKSRAPYKMDKFRKIVTDPFYAGIVEMDKQVKYRNENGLHEPLITKEQHFELLQIMDAKKKFQKGPRKNGNPHYPLSNLVSCDLCIDKANNRYVGYNHGNGHSDKVYEKYRCRVCHRRITRQELHDKIQDYFDSNRMSQKGVNEVLRALDIVWKRQEGQIEQEINRINHKIKVLNDSIANHVEAATEPSNASIKQDILAAIERKKAEIEVLTEELEKHSQDAKDDKNRFLRFVFDLIENMGDRFLELSKEDRLRCKQIIFPAGFYLNAENNVYTPEISPLITLQTNKKDAEASDIDHMVQDR